MFPSGYNLSFGVYCYFCSFYCSNDLKMLCNWCGGGVKDTVRGEKYVDDRGFL